MVAQEKIANGRFCECVINNRGSVVAEGRGKVGNSVELDRE
jgi:hypothetical protein